MESRLRKVEEEGLYHLFQGDHVLKVFQRANGGPGLNRDPCSEFRPSRVGRASAAVPDARQRQRGGVAESDAARECRRQRLVVIVD